MAGDLSVNLHLIWSRLTEGWGLNMADLADRIDDLICSFEHGPGSAMDTMAMLVFGWLIFGVIVFAVGNYAYGKMQGGKADEAKEGARYKRAPVAAAEAPAAVGANDVKAAAKPEAAAVPKQPTDATQSASVSAALDLASSQRPQPPARTKKLSGGSPGTATKQQQLSATSTLSPVAVPTTTGPDSDSVEWVNKVLGVMYTDPKVLAEVKNGMLRTLNEFAVKAGNENEMSIEVRDFSLAGSAPLLSNLFAERDNNDNITLTCDCEVGFVADVRVEIPSDKTVEVLNYRAVVEKVQGRLNVGCLTDKLLCAVRLSGWPEIHVNVVPADEDSKAKTDKQIEDVVAELLTAALRNGTLNLDLSSSSSSLQFVPHAREANTVQRSKVTSASLIARPAHDRSYTTRRLLVKVIKASNLGVGKGCKDPCCVVEMDEPPQKYVTVVQKSTTNPFWDEHFLFDVSSVSAEVLFEIYDKSKESGNFLGLGIVGIDELIAKPSQRQIITLQPRPYEHDQVSGSLTVEFLFMEGAEIPMTPSNRAIKTTETSQMVSPTGALVTTTRTTFAKPKDYLENDLKDTALRELENNGGLASGNANRTTLIIHSVQRGNQMGEQDGTGEVTGVLPLGVPAADTDRGRSRKKKRDFFSTIKRRLSKSKTRSQSSGPGSKDYDNLVLEARSVSADRGQDAAFQGNLLIVPGNKDDGSTRSSLSEMSGISSASTKTYVNEDSILVLETVENSVKKHYLVPLSVAQKGKWKKKGTKLHIYNDHTFVAKHLPGGMLCQVCGKAIARRLGKQGYECRDCQFRCHKHCHVKVDVLCPSSTIHNIELETCFPFISRVSVNNFANKNDHLHKIPEEEAV